MFYRIVALGQLRRIVYKPSSHNSLLLRVWQDGFRDMKDAGVQFHKEVPEGDHLKSWFPKGGFLGLDDLVAKGGKTKSCWIYSPNIVIVKISPCFTRARHVSTMQGIYAKSISRNAHYIIAFKNPQDQLGLRNLLLQAFPTFWQDLMVVYQKVSERPFGYTVLDLHSAGDDGKRVFSHLLTHEGFQRWHQRKREDVLSLTRMTKNLFNRLGTFKACCLG